MWDNWVLDVSLDPPVFVPIEGDIAGEYTLIAGMNLIADYPPGRLVAIVHEDGQEAVERWIADHPDEIERLRVVASKEPA